jgi:hypothetical protein
MAMTEAYLNAIATEGATIITHIGLLDEYGVELDGGDPAYARKAVTWEGTASGGAIENGYIKPNADLTFDVPAATTVAGWSGFSADENGTEYGGADLTAESFTNQGQYKLLNAGTGISHEVPAS